MTKSKPKKKNTRVKSVDTQENNPTVTPPTNEKQNSTIQKDLSDKIKISATLEQVEQLENNQQYDQHEQSGEISALFKPIGNKVETSKMNFTNISGSGSTGGPTQDTSIYGATYGASSIAATQETNNIRDEPHATTLQHLQQTRDLLYPSPPPPLPPPPPQNYQQYYNHNNQRGHHETFTPRNNTQMLTQQGEHDGNFPPPPPPNIPTGYSSNNRNNENQSQQILQLLQGLDARLGTRLTNIESRFSNIETKMEAQSQNWQTLETAIIKQNSRIDALEGKLSCVGDMKSTVAQLQINADRIDKHVNQNTERLLECEACVDMVANLSDDSQSQNAKIKEDLTSLKKKVESLLKENSDLREKQEEAEEKLLDLQCRSMRDNLIFFGIEEKQNIDNAQENTQEQAENDLDEFLTNVMHVGNKIPFHRVHRLGRRRRDQTRPRPIIAKFVDFKQREQIRHSAADKLTNTDFGIKEQFPKEIEDRRKPLYQVKRQAKAQGKKTTLVKDKLYIDDKLYQPNRTENDRPVVRSRNMFYNTTRVYQSRYRSQEPRQTGNQHNFETPNRFHTLSEEERRNTTQQNNKRPARSPLEAEVQKKYREENTGEYDSESDVEIVIDTKKGTEIPLKQSQKSDDNQRTEQEFHPDETTAKR